VPLTLFYFGQVADALLLVLIALLQALDFFGIGSEFAELLAEQGEGTIELVSVFGSAFLAF